jgi:hypothetical protein
MAGLRDLLGAPQVVKTQLPSPTGQLKMLPAIGASPFQRGLRSAALSDQAGARMQASLEAAARGDTAKRRNSQE